MTSSTFNRVLRACPTVLFLVSLSASAPADEPTDLLIGRWDLVMNARTGAHPSWLEVRQSGYATLVGSFVGRFGSSRPISKIEMIEGGYRFAIPPQWEGKAGELVFTFTRDGDQLQGQTKDLEGREIPWTANRAPTLARDHSPDWGAAIELFNGTDLAQWTVQLDDVTNGWLVRGGLLVNEKPGNNLVSAQKFDDFKLHAEFRYPEKSNSGLYLRGRYEVQIQDNYGGEPGCRKMGGVYGFLTPSVNAAKPAGEWQTLDIELIGRTVTVQLNGERVIDRQAIPGITGGALDSDEGAPGPIMIQGDHGPIEFRKLTITPTKVP